MSTRKFKNYIFNQSEISDIILEEVGTNFLWIAFKKLGSTCLLRKVSANNPNQTYFNINISVDEIKKLAYYNNIIYLAVDSSNYIGYMYATSNPFSTFGTLSIPSGINEVPVDVTTDDTYVYFLTPGNEIGEVAKIIKFTLAGVFDEIISLEKIGTEVKNAVSFTIDENGEIRIITSSDPTELVRVYQTVGVWDFSIENLST